MTPTALRTLSDTYYRQQQGTARAAARRVQELWRGLPSGAPLVDQWRWWESVRPAMADAMAQAQHKNAVRSTEYLTLAAAVQGAPVDTLPKVNPLAFVAATEVALDALDAGMGAYTYRQVQGRAESAARLSGAASLVRTAATFAQDAGREATGVGIAAAPVFKGYTRMVVGDTCPRCMILAGARYDAQDAFERHDLCDCVHVPAAEWFDDGTQDFAEALKAGRVSRLPKGDAKAILDGADPSQVINAKSGISTARIYGRDIQVTSAGNTRRSVAGKRLSQEGYAREGGRYFIRKTPRLTPSAIYKVAAGDRAVALNLLRRHGYIL